MELTSEEIKQTLSEETNAVCMLGRQALGLQWCECTLM